MKGMIQRPAAAAIIGSLRSIGYSFETALADVIDNSVSAQAKSIQITLEKISSDHVLSIADDGNGMDRDELIEAMRHGGGGSSRKRLSDDLGRYGLGLKTASLSQCRRLTVASIGKSGTMSVVRWDLDEVERTNEWTMLLPPKTTLAVFKPIIELRKRRQGTVVLWEAFDLALAGSANADLALETLLDDARPHLSLVFQRFLKGGDAKRYVELSINGTPLHGIDPFLSSNPKTQQMPPEDVKLGSAKITITAFILPQIKNITQSELTQLGGQSGIRNGQGFYVYRNKRLIIAGTWFRMLRLDELTKLARVRIDIPNTIDHLWNLDVKKSTATPPDAVKRVLKRIIDRIANRSLEAFKDRAKRGKSIPVVPIWMRESHRNFTTYKINRDHPMISDVLDDGSRGRLRPVDRVLKLIEISLPYASISADINGNNTLNALPVELEKTMRALLAEWMAKCADDADMKKSILLALPSLEPFALHPDLTRALVEEYQSGV
jgi:hypothetical protein